MSTILNQGFKLVSQFGNSFLDVGGDQDMMDEEMMGTNWFSQDMMNSLAIYSPLMMLIGLILYVVISIVIINYVTQDAIGKKLPNVEIWVLILLVFNLFGLLIYYIVAKNYEYSNRELPQA